MNDFIKKAVLAAMTMPLALMVEASSPYFEADFTAKTFPKTITQTSEGPSYVKSMYKQTAISDKWVRTEVGTNTAAVCPTYTDKPGETFKRTMTTPAFTVDDEAAILRWRGRSVLPDFGEAYNVLAKETSGATTVLFSTEAEESWWKSHIVSLAQFKGKEISISFECVSDNKYMLAIDDIYAGVPEEAQWEAKLLSPKFQSMEDGFVTVLLTNYGADAKVASIKCLSGTTEVDKQDLGDVIKSGESKEVTLSLAPLKNQKVSFTVQVTGEDSTTANVLTDAVYFSNFRRRHVMDKATGTWCNNCPEGIIAAQAAERKYGDELIIIEAHARPDVLANEEYWTPLRFYAAPYFMMNRNHNYINSGFNETVENGMYKEVKARIDITDVEIEAASRMMHIEAEVEFANYLDNTEDKVRLAYCFTHNVYDSTKGITYNQSNSCTQSKHEQYYHLPSTVPQWLNSMHNVNVSGAIAHFGVANSIPAYVSAMSPEKVTIDIELPEAIVDFKEDARIALYIIEDKTFTNDNGKADGNAEILNADYRKFDQLINVSARPIINDSVISASGEKEYYDLQGRRVENPGAGIYICRQGNKVEKIVKR